MKFMKFNKKGFTLIELLAVVTIMGILMLVAIPAIARTIENTRRDTFNDTAKKYINAIRDELIADQLDCEGTSVGATPNGNYIFLISTDTIDDYTVGSGEDSFIVDVHQNTLDLLESGGKSSWGKSNVKGAVVWNKQSNPTNDGYEITYYVFLVDAGNHGISTLTEESSLVRGSVLSNTVSKTKYTDMTNSSSIVTELLKNIGTLESLKTSDDKLNATVCRLAH